MGCDAVEYRYTAFLYVSIHAPAWGATVSITLSPCLIMFQSTHPHGVRPAWQPPQLCGFPFQSTHPHGVRRINPRFHLGTALFQSTHPHGVRLSVRNEAVPKIGFNPRTRMGCDTDYIFQTYSMRRFNPRTRMGCDWKLPAL